MSAETQRARELLASSEKTLRQSRNRPRADDRLKLLSPDGRTIGLAPAQPCFTREAQALFDQRAAKEAAAEEQQSVQVRRLTKRLRALEAKFAIAERQHRAGYLTTAMPPPQRPGRRR